MYDSARYGMIDSTGRIVIHTGYGYLSGFSEGLCPANNYGIFRIDVLAVDGGEWGYIDKNDQWIIPPQYEDAAMFHNGLAAVKKNGKWGIINKDNKMVIPAKYESISQFNNGVASFTQDGKSGLIDAKGKVIVKPEYDAVYTNASGSSVVNKGRKYNEFYDINDYGKSGVMDNTGKLILPVIYESVSSLKYGFYELTLKDGLTGYANSKGKIIWEPSK
jgi:hypothetical protein